MADSRLDDFVEDPTTAIMPPPPPRDGLDFELLDKAKGKCAAVKAAVTSRISVQKFFSVAVQFDDFKRNLARETGLGGMLRLKMIPKLNLKFSAWLMGRVDPEARSISFDDGRTIHFRGQDMSNVFGLPCFGEKLSQAQPYLSDACIEYARVADSMSDKGTRSLKAAEHFLMKPLNVSSSQLEIDCFKIAYVIFAVGHVLCPSSRHDSTTVDYWEALSNISRIHEYNWSEYVIEHLMVAVRKLKTDMQKRRSKIILVGCHLFLQVFVLDNMDMGALTHRQPTSTRISLFDYDTLRKMVGALTSSVSGESTFFLTHGFREDDVGYSCTLVCLHAKTPQMKAPSVTHLATPSHNPVLHASDQLPGKSANIVPRSTRVLEPIEFSNHLRKRYPDADCHDDCIMLGELYAKMMTWIDQCGQNIEDEMYAFSDKWLAQEKKRRSMAETSGQNQVYAAHINQQDIQMHTPSGKLQHTEKNHHAKRQAYRLNQSSGKLQHTGKN